jgi:hypothetical protein
VTPAPFKAPHVEWQTEQFRLYLLEYDVTAWLSSDKTKNTTAITKQKEPMIFPGIAIPFKISSELIALQGWLKLTYGAMRSAIPKLSLRNNTAVLARRNAVKPQIPPPRSAFIQILSATQYGDHS